jgi:hypothetical protein
MTDNKPPHDRAESQADRSHQNILVSITRPNRLQARERRTDRGFGRLMVCSLRVSREILHVSSAS